MILAEIVLTKKNSMKKIGLVKNPAVELNYLKLSMEKPLNMSVNNEKHDITGVALIPNKQYYRNKEFFGGDEDGYIFFTTETVKAIAIDYLNYAGNAIDLQHKDDVDGEDISIVESWIVETENDKIYDLGFSKDDVPIGSWCMTQHIYDDKLWEEVKKNTNGFSIEGRFSTRVIAENIEMHKQINEDEIVMAVVDVIANELKLK